MPAPDLDLLVLGSGVAGLTAAVRAAAEPGFRVGVLSKADLASSASAWAQGGVAAVLSEEGTGLGAASGYPDNARPPDSVELHIADTLAAGAGLCDPDAVAVLVAEGPLRVLDLVGAGANFDRDPRGALHLAREGGHSTARVVHAGGAATGAEIQRALVEATRRSTCRLWEGWFALDLVVEGGRCKGVRAEGPDGTCEELRAAHTLVATGGAGQLFAVTTNPPQSTGDGIAMALRAGLAVADMEFMQFHPTALHDDAMPRSLLSEALRGEGALLRDRDGQRFVDELSPRDVVARAMAARMLDTDAEHLWLDATPVDDLDKRFPTLAAPLRAAGLDPARDWLPVAPAAHYLAGGVMTDLDGASELAGLWAAGEAACTGVHGANRLASNSLLEGMVFAARVVDAIGRGKESPAPTGVLRPVLGGGEPGAVGVRRLDDALPAWLPAWVPDPPEGRRDLQRAMSVGAGVLRSAESLAGAAKEVERLAAPSAAPPGPAGGASAGHEMANLLTVACALLGAASGREESRGCHSRRDFPETSAAFAHRFVQ
ncbi:MAG: L-aspartate oxidase [Acidimicrobiales bacterium]